MVNPRQRYRCCNLRALPGRRGEGERPVHKPYALHHAEDSQACLTTCWVTGEPHSVVRNTQLYKSILDVNCYANCCSAPVNGGVAHALLGDPIEASGTEVPKLRILHGAVEVDPDSMDSFKFFAEFFQRRAQPEIR